MLPDVPVEEWDQYQSDVFRNDTDQRIASLPLHVAPIRDDWMQPGAFAPTPPSDSLTNPLGAGNQPAPEPQPIPETTPPPDVPATPPVVNSGYPAPDAPLPLDFGTHADTRIASLTAPPPSASASSLPAGQATSSTVNGVSGSPDLVAQTMNAADAEGVDPNLYVSLIQQESNFDPRAGSPAGAKGLSQLMDATARGLGVTDPWDPIQSLRGGARYLKQQLDHFGGDVVKALAAYNAGPGAVEKYGGIPPYEETQRYVKQVMGRLSDEPIDTSQITGQPGTYAPGPAEGLARVGSSLETQQGPASANQISQFGDPQLTADEAYAACGPAAAVRFASMYGRNPTLREATNLARSVGWTPAQGMAGIDSEASLMQKIGVPVKVVRGPQWDVFAKEAQTGNPVTISTSGHYFFADGYDPTTGKFHVGRSGLDLRRGAEWMSPDQMTAVMGPVQGALLADNPQIPAPSTADQQDNPVAWLSRTKDAIGSSFGGAVQTAADTVSGVASSLFGPQPAGQPAASQPMPSDALTNPLGTGNAPQSPPASSMTPPQPQQPQQSVWDRVGQGISDVFKSAFGQEPAGQPASMQPTPSDTLTNPTLLNTTPPDQRPPSALDQAISGAVQRGQSNLAARGIQLDQPGSQTLPATPLTSENFPSVLDPNHPSNIYTDLSQKYASLSDPLNLHIRDRMTPEDQAKWDSLAVQVGGVEFPELPKVGEAAAGVKVPNIPERPLPQGAQPISLTPAEDVARLRLEDFPADVRPTIQQAAEDVNFAQAQRRGVIPDDVAQQMAQQYAQDTTLDQMIRQGAAGRAYNTEQIRALRNATAGQAVKVNDIAAAISKGDDSSAALANFFTEGQRLQRLVQISEGARAEAGRSLRAYQDPAQLVNLAPNDAVARITKMIGGDRDKLLGAVQDYQKLVDTGAGPVQMANFWSALQNPVGPGDWFKLVRYNSMLSGPRSIEVNVIGNALELPWRLARDTGASIARGRPEEIGPEVSGMFAGLTQANQRFMETLTQGITTEAAARGEIPRSVSARLQNPAAKGVATTLEFPGRLMGAADEWANAIAYNMGLGREAAVQASKEGLRGDAWNTRVTQILADPHTAPNLMQRADGIAQRMTYHGEMGNIGQGLQAFTQKAGIVGNLVLPFLRTVYHITARGIDRSPVGLVGTGIDVARGAYGRNLGEALAGRSQMPKGVAPLGERLGDNLMGSAVFSALLTKALDGQISAAGPDDQGRKALLQSEGWQPYSIHVGDKWISYANWGPAAIPFALAGATAEAYRFRKTDDVGPMVLDGMRRTAQVVQQQTYLQSIGAAWQGLNDPQRYGFQFVNNTIGSLIPYGAAINTAGQSADVYARRPDKFDIGDAIRNRLPPYTPVIGGRESVPTAQDVLGRPAPNTRAGAAALNPLLVSPERADPVLQELDRVGIAPPSPPQTVTRNGKAVQLTPDEQRQVQSDAGQSIADRINTEIKAPSYVTLTDDAKAKRLQRVIDLARQQAENRFVSSLTDADYQKRVQQSQAQRQKVPVSGR